MSQIMNQKPRLTNVYPYRDETGTVLYEACRYVEIVDGITDKTFKQRAVLPDGTRSWKMDGVRRVLYHLPEVITAAEQGAWVLIPEGEKDVDNLRELGFYATTNVGGASKGNWKDEYSVFLTGANVVVLPDNDEVGEKHAVEVAESALPYAASVRILRLPNLPPKGDVSDSIALRRSLDNPSDDQLATELLKLINDTPLYVPAPKVPERKPEPKQVTAPASPSSEPTEEIESEWQVVGCLARGGSKVAAVVEPLLSVEDFSDVNCGIAYRVVLSLLREGAVITASLFREALRDAFAETGREFHRATEDARETVHKAISLASAPSNVLIHARTVSDYSQMRKAKQAVAVLFSEGRNWKGTPAEYIAKAQRDLMALSQTAPEEKPSMVPEVGMEWFREYRKSYSLNNTGVLGFDTGYRNLNTYLRGLRNGHLTIIAGRSSEGKSTLAVNLARNVCRIGKQVLVTEDGQEYLKHVPRSAAAQIFSLEMPQGENLERLLYAESGMDSSAYYGKKFSQQDWDRLEAHARDVFSLRMAIHDDTRMTTERIASISRAAKFRGDCDIVFVDYTQIITPAARKSNQTREREVAEIADDMKRLAGELNVPIVLLSQLNDEGLVRESRNIKNAANVLLILERHEKLDEIEKALPNTPNQEKSLSYTLHVDKCRHGRTGKVPMMFYPYITRFEEENLSDDDQF